MLIHLCHGGATLRVFPKQLVVLCLLRPVFQALFGPSLAAQGMCALLTTQHVPSRKFQVTNN